MINDEQVAAVWIEMQNSQVYILERRAHTDRISRETDNTWR